MDVLERELADFRSGAVPAPPTLGSLRRRGRQLRRRRNARRLCTGTALLAVIVVAATLLTAPTPESTIVADDGQSDVTADTTGRPGTDDSRQADATTSEHDVEATVYLYDLGEKARTAGGTNLRLTPITIPVPGHDIVQEALAALWEPRLRSDSRLTTAIPSASELLSATVDPSGRMVVVDTSGLLGEGGLVGIDLAHALAQVVWTATAHTGVVEVQFLDEGEPVQVLIDGLARVDRPVSRADYGIVG